MTDRLTSSYIKKYSELLLYCALILLLALHKAFAFPNLSLFILLSPLLFKDFKLLDRWSLLWLFIPFANFMGYKPYEILNLSLFAFAEELFFRAYLMQRYSNLAVSFMFVLPHLLLNPSLSAVLTFFPSLIFGYAYRLTNSLSFSSFLHFWSNAVYLRALALWDFPRILHIPLF